MLIGINERNEIKQINVITDETLTQIEVDRELVFGNMSDFMILNYCYKPSDNGYSVYPAKDYSMLELLDSQLVNKISILTEQNNQQEEIIASLTYDLMMMQEPIIIATLINNHSPKYNLIKSWFNKGYWNEDMLLNAVEKHYITEEEMNEIIG